MPRIAVIGSSGAGKTTCAASLAARLGVPHVELDAIYHQADWTALPLDEFRTRVARHAEKADWVIDGNYGTVRDLVWGAADTLVWLDLPRRTVMTRVMGRTLRRVLTRQRLWNGNTEQWRNLLSTDPETSIVLWAWTTHGPNRRDFAAALADPRWTHLHVVHLHTTAGAVEVVSRELATSRPTCPAPSDEA